jgi:hypothetical protein
MAHFAELDENNIVLRVVNIGNDVPTPNGPLGNNNMSPAGEEYCTNLFGGRWKQTSYSGAFRGGYAGSGYYFNEEKNLFIEPQPYPSWTFDNINNVWLAPFYYPEADNITYSTQWREDLYTWEGINQGDTYLWDNSTQNWNKI